MLSLLDVLYLFDYVNTFDIHVNIYLCYPTVIIRPTENPKSELFFPGT